MKQVQWMEGRPVSLGSGREEGTGNPEGICGIWRLQALHCVVIFHLRVQGSQWHLSTRQEVMKFLLGDHWLPCKERFMSSLNKHLSSNCFLSCVWHSGEMQEWMMPLPLRWVLFCFVLMWEEIEALIVVWIELLGIFKWRKVWRKSQGHPRAGDSPHWWIGFINGRCRRKWLVGGNRILEKNGHSFPTDEGRLEEGEQRDRTEGRWLQVLDKLESGIVWAANCKASSADLGKKKKFLNQITKKV